MSIFRCQLYIKIITFQIQGSYPKGYPNTICNIRWDKHKIVVDLSRFIVYT